MDLTELPLWVNIAIVFGVLILCIGSGMWVALALAATGVFTLAILAGGRQGMVDALLYDSVDSFVLVAIPMFIFLGEIILKSGLSSGLYTGVSKWTGIIPGGLLHSNIMASAIFAAVCGSSVATAATIGTVAYKDQKTRGYDYRMIGGSIAAGGTLGILIPPSITMIVYGDFVGVSVARLFAAGVVPGIILAILFMCWIAIAATANPSVAVSKEKLTRAYFSRALGAFKDVWPILILIMIIFTGIYGGLTTPSEAAAVSCFVALILSAFFKKLSFNMFKDSALSALRTSGMVLLVIVFAKILGTGMSMIKLPAEMSEFISSLGLSRMAIWVGVILMYLVLGCFIEALPMILLTLPITFPLVVMKLGFDPVWFGVTIVILSECALITPPVGLNLYVMHGIARDEKIEHLIAGVLPFVVLLLVLLALLTAFPILATWLPNVLFPKY